VPTISVMNGPTQLPQNAHHVTPGGLGGVVTFSIFATFPARERSPFTKGGPGVPPLSRVAGPPRYADGTGHSHS
jgi:hypothetical protein